MRRFIVSPEGKVQEVFFGEDAQSTSGRKGALVMRNDRLSHIRKDDEGNEIFEELNNE